MAVNLSVIRYNFVWNTGGETPAVGVSPPAAATSDRHHLATLLVKSENFKMIDHKFPESGHSYMDSDRDFGHVERKVREISNVYDAVQSAWWGRSPRTAAGLRKRSTTVVTLQFTGTFALRSMSLSVDILGFSSIFCSLANLMQLAYISAVTSFLAIFAAQHYLQIGSLLVIPHSWRHKCKAVKL